MNAVAEGPLKTLLIFIGVFTLVVGGVTYSGPFTTEYEVKTAARVACNEMIKDLRYRGVDSRVWETEFMTKTRGAGVNLTKEQYSFNVTLGETMECHAVIVWRSKTDIFLLTDALDLKPLSMIQRVDLVHQVNRHY